MVTHGFLFVLFVAGAAYLALFSAPRKVFFLSGVLDMPSCMSLIVEVALDFLVMSFVGWYMVRTWHQLV